MTPEEYQALLVKHGVPIKLDADLGALELMGALERSDDDVVAAVVQCGLLNDNRRFVLVLPPDRDVMERVRSAAMALSSTYALAGPNLVRDMDDAIARLSPPSSSSVATCLPAPRAGARRSGYLWPKCGEPVDVGDACDGLSGKERKAKIKAMAKAGQHDDWDRGKIPTAPPEDYDPGRPVPGAKPLPDALDDRKNVISERHKDPDLDWFVEDGKIIVLFSGGKDSLACALYVLELCRKLGINPTEKIELWHHCVDGRPQEHGGSEDAIWDWPVTEDYCRKIAGCLGLPIYFSWREGGIMGEVLKEDAATAVMSMEMPDRTLLEKGGIGDEQTRRSFPKQGSIEGGRWCSSVVKIDVGRSQLSNRKDLYGKRVLVVSGERAEESSARSQIPKREFDALWKGGKWSGRHGSRDRHVERWRPIHRWCEIDVWAIIARWKITAHPAYRLGWGRLSCMTCIFGSPSQWATIREIDPARFDLFVRTERKLLRERDALLEHASAKEAETIKRRRLPLVHQDEPLLEFAAKKPPYPMALKQPKLVRIALSRKWSESPVSDPWKLPAGAFGENAGPT